MKTILVTGSTDGIGRAAARELAERGCAVIAHGRSERRAQQAARAIAAAGASGCYFVDRRQTRPASATGHVCLAADLWRVSSARTGLTRSAD